MQPRLKFSLCALLAFAAAAQSLPVPDTILYLAVSQRIAGTKTFADHLAAEGKKDDAVRGSLKKELGLTDAEYAAVEPIALDFIAASQKRFDARTAAFKAANGQPLTAAQTAAVNASEAAYQTAAAEHIAQFQTALGNRFHILDNWARKEVLPHIGYSQMTKGAK